MIGHSRADDDDDAEYDEILMDLADRLHSGPFLSSQNRSHLHDEDRNQGMDMSGG